MLGLTAADIRCVHLEVGLRQFYVNKLYSEEKLRQVLSRRHVDYALPCGTATRVKLQDAGQGTAAARVFRLPPEVKNAAVTSALAQGRSSAARRKSGVRTGTLNGVRSVKAKGQVKMGSTRNI